MATPAVIPPDASSSNLLDTPGPSTSKVESNVQGGHIMNQILTEHIQIVDEQKQFKCVLRSFRITFALFATGHLLKFLFIFFLRWNVT